ncbi:hypothetical protein Pelo_8040 [Pelomyxa schiedti]|nr:hypothetical protein Pelo_8040 [Pelomyxa schiedti]
MVLELIVAPCMVSWLCGLTCSLVLVAFIVAQVIHISDYDAKFIHKRDLIEKMPPYVFYFFAMVILLHCGIAFLFFHWLTLSYKKKTLNRLMQKEFYCFVFLFAAFLVAALWPEVLFHIPMGLLYFFSWITKKYRSDPAGVPNTLLQLKVFTFFRLFYFVISFFFSLYRMSYYLLQVYLHY